MSWKVNVSAASASFDATFRFDRKTKATTLLVDKVKQLPPRPTTNGADLPAETVNLPIRPGDPEDLQQVFDKVNSPEGIVNNTIKIYDALKATPGHESEVQEIQDVMDGKLDMPPFLAYNGVMEEYVGAGRTEDALKVYRRIIDFGSTPNSYTYGVLIKALAADPDPKFLGDATKLLLEMMDMDLRLDVATYSAVFKAFVRRGKEAEAKKFLKEMKEKGFVAEERELREFFKGKRSAVIKTVIRILLEK